MENKSINKIPKIGDTVYWDGYFKAEVLEIHADGRVRITFDVKYMGKSRKGYATVWPTYLETEGTSEEKK